MKAHLFITAYFLILLGSACLTSCNVSKRISNKKEKTKSSSESTSSGSIRQELNEDWTRIYSSLFHRNGNIWIEFDSIAKIDLTPSGMRAIGYNPVIHGNVSTIKKDSLTELGSAVLVIEQDSSRQEQKSSESESESREKNKEQKSQKIAPIIVLVLLVVIALIYAAKQIKLF